MGAFLADELSRRMEIQGLDADAGALVLAACEGEATLNELLGVGPLGAFGAVGAFGAFGEGDKSSGSRHGGAAESSSSEPTASEPTASEPAPPGPAAGVFLRAITVEGFRGIGPEAKLSLQPGPGLTLVIGRNGSGKSSFAEAIELLLTRNNQRWEGRAAAWKDDWRNVHHSGPTKVRADFDIAGHAGPTIVEGSWPPGALPDGGTITAQHKSATRQGFESLAWTEGLSVYRPFLSYSELGSILDKGPSKLFDALNRVLGVDDIAAVTELLAAARKRQREAEAATKAAAAALLVRLREIPDLRAAAATEALTKRRRDLDALELVVAGVDESADAADELARLRTLSALVGPDLVAIGAIAEALRVAISAVEATAGTEAGSARELAGLLERALAHHRSHGDEDCPICGRESALDAAWARDAGAQYSSLIEMAGAAEAAHRQLAATMQAACIAVTNPPEALDDGPARVTWEVWAATARETDPSRVAELLEDGAVSLDSLLASVRDEAATELHRREDLWRPVALELAAWLVGARRLQANAVLAGHLSAAYEWAQAAARDTRNERFAPIAVKAKAVWALLRQQSNVDLADIVLAGTNTARKVVLEVRVDGVAGAALGVMSQGELYALALSLFLPRATMEESPFRFVVIDDPVQSMDPARVDGLARVLEQVALSRQVIVFSHDDRLADATRRLQINARVLEVTRHVNSVVEVRAALDPTARALGDAMAVALTTDLPEEIGRRVVPGFCRLAIEARCADIVRRRRLGRGEDFAVVEEMLAGQSRLGAMVSLALFDDPHRSNGDIRERLSQKFGTRSVAAYFSCVQGAHQPANGDLADFVKDVQVLVADFERLT